MNTQGDTPDYESLNSERNTLIDVIDKLERQNKSLIDEIEKLEKLHTLGLQALVESNNEKAQLKARVEELNASLLDVATKSANKVVELQSRIDELEKANEWISIYKKTPFTYLSGNWDGLMSDEILVKDNKGIINVARCYTGIIDGHSFVDFYDNRYFELKNIIQWKKLTNEILWSEDTEVLSQDDVSIRSKQLVCDTCKRDKQTNMLEDCKCGKGKTWIKEK